MTKKHPKTIARQKVKSAGRRSVAKPAAVQLPVKRSILTRLKEFFK